MASAFVVVVQAIVGLVVLAFGLGLLKIAWDHLSRSIRIAEAETADVDDLQPGLVQLEGTARPIEDGETHRAPIGDVPALASTVEVTKKPAKRWMPVHKDERTEPFVLDDGTGQVRVEPTEETRVNLDERMVYLEPTDEAPADVKRFAEEAGLVEQEGRVMVESDPDRTVRYKYLAGRLEPGEEAYVLGDAVPASDDAGVVVTGDDFELVVSDHPEEALVDEERKEGVIWAAVGAMITVGGVVLILP